MINLDNFKPIENYEDYLVSKNGDIFSKKRNKFLKPRDNGNGYLKVGLCRNKKYKNFFIHRLVAITHLNNPDNLPQVNHINGIKTDNRIENLEWCTASQNTQNAWKLGLKENARAAARQNGKNVGKINVKRAQEANIKHLDDNLKELFDDIFINKLKIKNIAKKYNISCQYIYQIKNKQRLQTAISEYFGDLNHEQQ